MKNTDIKAKMQLNGIEWLEVARFLDIPMKDFVRRLNGRTVSPVFRRKLLQAIESIRKRPESFYNDFKL